MWLKLSLRKTADEEELLTRKELIERLRQANLNVTTSEVKYTPKSLKKSFDKVKPPKEHFMMSTNDELFWVSRFNTIGQAKQVNSNFDDGFRFSNWHFAGQISVETTNAIVKALETNQKHD